MTDKLYTQSDMEALRERCAKVADIYVADAKLFTDDPHVDGDCRLKAETHRDVSLAIAHDIRALPISTESEKP